MRATDPSGASATQPVTVTVNDVNDAPTFAKYDAGTQDNNATALHVVENSPTSLANTAAAAEAFAADDTAIPAANTASYLAADADDGDGFPAAPTGTPPVVVLTYEVTGADASAFVSPVAADATSGVATLAFKSDHTPNFEKQD